MERLKHIIEINILLGAWLVAAPFILGYSSSTAELANDVAIGALLIGCSWWILAAMPAPLGCGALQFLGALWIVGAPFYFHYEKQSRAYTNDLFIGVLAVIVSATATWMMATQLRRPV
jgi:hypothetical protein